MKQNLLTALDNKSTDWVKVKSELEEVIDLRVPLKTKSQQDNEAERFVKILQNTVRKYTNNYEKQDVSSSYPKEMRVKVVKKRKARKRWQETKYPSNKIILNRITHELIAAIKNYKQKCFGTYLRELTAKKDSDYSLWKAARKIKRPNI